MYQDLRVCSFLDIIGTTAPFSRPSSNVFLAILLLGKPSCPVSKRGQTPTFLGRSMKWRPLAAYEIRAFV